MVRTIVVILVLMLAVFWLPLWAQLGLFVVAILVDPNRIAAIIPAIVSDALYAPGSALTLTAHWMTVTVLALLAVHYLVMRKLRVRSLYGLET